MEENPKTSMLSLGFLGKLKQQNMKFNPRPFSDPKHLSSQQMDTDDNFVDFHLEVVEKVDALIAELEDKDQKEIREKETGSIQRPSWWMKRDGFGTNDSSFLH